MPRIESLLSRFVLFAVYCLNRGLPRILQMPRIEGIPSRLDSFFAVDCRLTLPTDLNVTKCHKMSHFVR